MPTRGRVGRAQRRDRDGLRGASPAARLLVRSDLDLWALRRRGGWAVAYFSSHGVTKEAIEEAAWEDHEGSGEEEYP